MHNMYKSIITLLAILLSSMSFAQQKEVLVQKIKELNILQDEDQGLTVLNPITDEEEYDTTFMKDNYANFKLLASMIDTVELLELARDSSPLIRMFAMRAIQKLQLESFDFGGAFIKELASNDSVLNQMGCSIAHTLTYKILFFDLVFSLRSSSNNSNDTAWQYFNNKLEPIDSFCIYNYQKGTLSESLLEDVLRRRNFSAMHLETITNLVLKHDNFLAFNYLMKNNPKVFREITQDNFKDKSFDIRKYPRDFCAFVNYAKETNNKNLENNLMQQFNKLENQQEFDWLIYNCINP